MAKGGARFTHENLLAADLDYLAIEAQIARAEIGKGQLEGERMVKRIQQFIEEAEFLARSGARHLRAMGAA